MKRSFAITSVLEWQKSTLLWKKIALSLFMATLTGFLAQIKIHLGFTPVPVTGQVLGVLLSGVFCGALWGMVSQIFYLSFGIAGIPWFATPTHIFGPTAGYLIGFIFAPFVVGYLIKILKSKTFLTHFLVMLAGVFVIYLCGILWISFYLNISFRKVFFLGVYPFVFIDIVKATVSAFISHQIFRHKI